MSAPTLLALADVAARTALLLVAANVLTRLLVRRPAAARHAVWAAALAGALVLPAASALAPRAVVRVPALGVLRPAVPSVIPMPAAERSAPTARPAHDAASEDIWSRVALDAPRSRPGAAAVVLALWLAGMLVVLARLVRSYALAAALVRRGAPVADAAALRLMDEVRRRHGVRRPVPLIETAEIAAPATVGALRPAVVLPIGAALDLRALRPILEHELAHVARRDGAVELLARLACAVHWYQPLVWRAARALGAERERACDDLVLASGVAPERYASVLLDAARAMRRGVATPVGVLALARPSELETRLVAILDDARPRSGLPRGVAVASVALSLVVATLTAAVRVEAAAPAATDLRPSPALGSRRLSEQPSHARRSRLSAAGARPRAVSREPSAASPRAAAPLAPEQPPATRLPAPEPDRRGDSVAMPRSERVAASDAEVDALLRRAAEAAPAFRAGPDSALAARLERSLGRVPDGPGDLVRERAAWALVAGRDGRLVEPLADALDAADWRVRAYAAWALAAAGPAARRDARVQPRLLAALEHPVWRLRAAAAYALRDVGDAAAVPAMRRALADAAWQVRVPAVDFLAAAGGAAEREALRAALADRHVVVRNAARDALALLDAR